ncbi:MAG: hypothetical protein WBG71_15255 [Leeuwenhoekiella sp.]
MKHIIALISLISCSLINCQAYDTFSRQDIDQIINLEMGLWDNTYRINTFFFSGKLKYTIIENRYDDKIPEYNLGRFLNDEKMHELFFEDHADFMIDQIDTSRTRRIAPYVTAIHKNKLLDIDKARKNAKQGDNIIYELSVQPMVYISKPVISKNGQYALIYLTKGPPTITESGIHLLEKVNNDWQFKKELMLYIE